MIMEELNKILHAGGLCSHISSENGDIVGGVSESDTLGIIAYRKGFSVRKEGASYKSILPSVKGRIAHEEMTANTEKEIGKMILDYYKDNGLI
jgi:hypothetical protein